MSVTNGLISITFLLIMYMSYFIPLFIYALLVRLLALRVVAMIVLILGKCGILVFTCMYPHTLMIIILCVCVCDILLLFSVYCVADGEGMEERGRREGGFKRLRVYIHVNKRERE